MSQPVTIVGSTIIVYINNKAYNEVQSITLDVDYGEESIYGIDSPWAQEIAPGRAMVRGSIKGLRTKLSGGLQGANLRPLFQDIAASPYVSIRITDRATSEDIVLITKAKITNESHAIAAKGSYKLSFDFVGQIPYFALDRSDT
jgi:hypothetical protein